MQVPQLIIDLINGGDGLLRFNSSYFNAATSIAGLSEAYNNGDKTSPAGKLDQNDLKEWYELSVKEDNFIGIFDSNYSVSSTNFLVTKYKTAIKSFSGRPSGDNGGTWYTFFSSRLNPSSPTAEKALLGGSSSGRYISPITLSQVSKLFREMASDANTKKFVTNKSAEKIAIEVLKAWSFFLSLKNFDAAEELAKNKATNAGESVFEDKDSLAVISQYLEDKEKFGSKADTLIADRVAGINEARNALNASVFNKQKYLIENMREISFLGELRDGDKLGLPLDRILKFTDSHRNAINKLVGADRGREMFKMPTIELSKLVPRLKIFKVGYDESMKKKSEIEIIFPTTFMGAKSRKKADLDPYEFVGTRKGYGIKSFSWEYKGADPFSVDRDITATLELYFQDFAEFTKRRAGGYRYVDLIVPLEKCYPQFKAVLGENFQQDIRVEAGWEVPQSLQSQITGGSKIASVKASQVNFILHPVDYNISFSGNGNGAATITINYRARIESIGKNRLINVIGATKDEVETVQYYEDKINNAPNEDEKRKFRKLQQDLYKLIKSDASKRFIKKLAKNRSIYWRYANLEEVMTSNFGATDAELYYKRLKRGDFSPEYKDGLYETLTQLATAPNTLPKDLILVKDANVIPSLKGDDKPEKILYTFLGDIFQVAIETAAKSGSFLGAPQDVIKNFKIALLDFRVGDDIYNLSTLPVEMGIFTEFLNNKIGKRDEYTKSFISFARELIAEVLINRIDTYFNLEDGTTRAFKIGYVEMNRGLEPLSERSYDLGKKEDLRKINKAKKNDFLVVYSDSPLPSDFKIMTSSGGYQRAKKRDEQAGLHHFSLGTESNIIKNISFDRLDLEYARERRLTMNAEDPYALLSNVFNVNISMFGNNFFRPGSYIYVDPKVMGDLGEPYRAGSISNIMGLGGYHIVTSVSHTVNLNSFETTLEAVWETSGDGESSFRGLKKKKSVEGKEEDKC